MLKLVLKSNDNEYFFDSKKEYLDFVKEQNLQRQQYKLFKSEW